MSEKQDFWDWRLRNWCFYYRGGTSVAHGCSSLCASEIKTPYWNETPEVAIAGDAIDTDRLVTKLEVTLQNAIIAWYWWSGTRDMVASRLGITRITLWRQIKTVKEKLNQYQFELRQALRKAA